MIKFNKKNKKIILICYLIFMFIFFKTKISFNHPLDIYLSDLSPYELLKHPISNTTFYESKICLFGKYFIIIFSFYLYFIEKKNIYNQLIFVIVFIMSFVMNFNAWIYLIPYYIYFLFKDF